MKIVCGSCQAKYSIADEKVAGKVFKIRCKRCSEVIVVRGDQENEAAPEGGNGSLAAGTNGSHATAAGYETSVDAIWHVVVNGEQAGPYAPNQLADMLRAGQLDWEAYVWCEGFENWLPMRDVPDLVSAISGQPAAAAAPAAAQPATQPSMGADPFADEAGAAVGMFAQPAAQAAARSNLFGGGDVASVPFDTSPKMIPSAAPSPRVTADQAMTGARNENSVLFSLKNLQALATGGSVAPGPGGPTSHRPGYAGGEGSGLIDIRALASATGVADQGRDDSDKDALLSLGSAQAGAFGALGSPMLAPGKVDDDSGKKGLALAIMGGFALLAGAAVAIAFILKPGSSPSSAVVAPVAPPPAAATAPAGGTMTATNNEPKSAATAEPPSEGELAARRAAEKAAPAPAAEHADRTRGASSKHADKTPADKPVEAAPKPAPDPLLATKPADKKPKGGSSSLDDLLEGAIGSKGGAANTPKAAAVDSNLPFIASFARRRDGCDERAEGSGQGVREGRDGRGVRERDRAR